MPKTVMCFGQYLAERFLVKKAARVVERFVLFFDMAVQICDMAFTIEDMAFKMVNMVVKIQDMAFKMEDVGFKMVHQGQNVTDLTPPKIT